MTTEELKKRISDIETPELIKLHELNQNYEIQILKIKTNKEIAFEKYRQKVNILLIENGYETEDSNE